MKQVHCVYFIFSKRNHKIGLKTMWNSEARLLNILYCASVLKKHQKLWVSAEVMIHSHTISNIPDKLHNHLDCCLIKNSQREKKITRHCLNSDLWHKVLKTTGIWFRVFYAPEACCYQSKSCVLFPYLIALILLKLFLGDLQDARLSHGTQS